MTYRGRRHGGVNKTFYLCNYRFFICNTVITGSFVYKYLLTTLLKILKFLNHFNRSYKFTPEAAMSSAKLHQSNGLLYLLYVLPWSERLLMEAFFTISREIHHYYSERTMFTIFLNLK